MSSDGGASNPNLAVLESAMNLNGPPHRGAPHPPFDPLSVNESAFSDGLRFKDVKVTPSPDGRTNELRINWVCQEWGDVKTLEDEFIRWGQATALSAAWDRSAQPVTVSVFVRNRHIYADAEECEAEDLPEGLAKFWFTLS